MGYTHQNSNLNWENRCQTVELTYNLIFMYTLYIYIYLFILCCIWAYIYIFNCRYIYTKHIYIHHHNYRGYIPMFLPIPICLTEPPSAKSWNLDLSWQNQCSPKPGLMIALLIKRGVLQNHTWKWWCWVAFPLQKNVFQSAGVDDQRATVKQLIVSKCCWWKHGDFMIIWYYMFCCTYTCTCTYIHVRMYACMCIYIYTWFLALQCIGGPNAPSPKREQQPHLSVVINSSPGSRTGKNDVKTMKPIWYCNLANKDGDRIRTLYI
jgi:hypothetical protein